MGREGIGPGCPLQRRRRAFPVAHPHWPAVFLAVAVATCPKVALGGAVNFLPQVQFATGAQPVDVKAADLNGDGNPDLAIANMGANTVTVLLGDGTGGFGHRVDFPTGAGPHALAICDINGDGKPDVVTANYVSNTVSVLLNDGNAGFGTRTDDGTGSEPFSVAIGDMNGDGAPDLAVADFGGPGVSLLLNDGHGAFPTRLDTAGGRTCASITLGDFNDDGYLDVAVAEVDAGVVGVFLGDGTGRLRSIHEFSAGLEPWSVGAADLNGDGRVDLAVADYFQLCVATLLGNGDGSFISSTYAPAGGLVRGLAVGDVDGTGTPDVVVAVESGNWIAALFGDGSGTLVSDPVLSTGSGPFAVAIADLNRDGLPDIVAANLSSSTVSVMIQGPPGPAVSLTLSADPSPSSYGGIVTLTAIVVPQDITMQVKYMDGSSTIGLGAIGNGVSVFQTSSLAVGTHQLRVVYGGDGQYRGGTSPVVEQTVMTGTTTTRLQSGAGVIARGEPLTLVAAVTAEVAGPSSPSGLVQFQLDGSDIGPPATLTGDTASVGPITLSSEGAHVVVASYLGDIDFAPSASPPETILVAGGTTSTTRPPQRMSLDGAWPNPSRGRAVTIAFGLASSAPARLELVDLSGRRLLVQSVDQLGPGQHTWTFRRSAAITPSVYFVRLVQGERTLVRRFAVLD